MYMSKKFLILHDFSYRITSVGGHHVYANLLFQFFQSKSYSSRISFRDSLIPLHIRYIPGFFRFLFSFFSEIRHIVINNNLVVIFNSVLSFECFLLYIFSILLRRKCFVIPHGMFSNKYANPLVSFRSFKGYLRFLYAYLLFSSSVNIIATSDLEKSYLASSISTLKSISVMPPSALYYPPSIKLSIPYPEIYLQRNHNIFTILCSGRITPSKGSEILFDVYKVLFKLHSSAVRLILLGPIDSSSIFKDSREFRHSMNLHAFDSSYNLSEFKALSNISDLFLTCSPSESFGMCIYEALSFGLPTVCSLGTPWQSLSSFNAGLCVPHTVPSYVEAVSHFINLPSSKRQLLSANAKRLSAKLNYYDESIPPLIFNL
jgi:glycosyltransferase involved in cell wall biosynthesis